MSDGMEEWVLDMVVECGLKEEGGKLRKGKSRNLASTYRMKGAVPPTQVSEAGWHCWIEGCRFSDGESGGG